MGAQIARQARLELGEADRFRCVRRRVRPDPKEGKNNGYDCNDQHCDGKLPMALDNRTKLARPELALGAAADVHHGRVSLFFRKAGHACSRSKNPERGEGLGGDCQCALFVGIVAHRPVDGERPFRGLGCAERVQPPTDATHGARTGNAVGPNAKWIGLCS